MKILTTFMFIAMASVAQAQMPAMGNIGIQMPGSPSAKSPNVPQTGHIWPNNSQPVKIRDSQGRITGTLSVRPNGVITARDNRGRVRQTATVRAGTINQRSAQGARPKAK